MKKIFGFLIVVCGVVLLTGCGSNNSSSGSSGTSGTSGSSKKGFICTARMEEDGETAKVEFDVTVDSNDKLKTVDVTFDFENEEYADQMYSLYQWVNSMTDNDDEKIDISKNGSKVTIKNYESIESEDDEDDVLSDMVGMTKEEFEKALKNEDTLSEVKCRSK